MRRHMAPPHTVKFFTSRPDFSISQLTLQAVEHIVAHIIEFKDDLFIDGRRFIAADIAGGAKATLCLYNGL